MTNESGAVSLEDLAGVRFLSGVSFGHGVPENPQWDMTEPATCIFVLDGATYTMTEDPSDGYRSHMEGIKREGACGNTFPPCAVLCRLDRGGPHKYHRTDDLLVMRDLMTGKPVLTIGTSNSDDYYPWYTAEFDPTAMAINQADRLFAGANQMNLRKEIVQAYCTGETPEKEILARTLAAVRKRRGLSHGVFNKGGKVCALGALHLAVKKEFATTQRGVVASSCFLQRIQDINDSVPDATMTERRRVVVAWLEAELATFT